MTFESWSANDIAPRSRVITDNDYGGDPDGLFELAHVLLSPSVEVACVVGSRARDGDGWDSSLEASTTAARTVVELTGRSNDVPVVAGSGSPLVDHTTPARNEAVDAIVSEALTNDTDLPLYVTCGASLTDVASAWLTEPLIGPRLTLVWIGGSEHDGHAEPPPGEGPMEYNLEIDPIAAQVVFNVSDIEIWQVPRNLYRTVLVSRAELAVRVAPHGQLGRKLVEALANTARMTADLGIRLGEAYILGDSPLVLLTALQSSFHPDASSSAYISMPCPRLLDSGAYAPDPDGRPIRVYTALDTRLLLEDLYAKVLEHAQP